MSSRTMHAAKGTEILGPVEGEHAGILTQEAVEFIALLSRQFEPRRRELLARRAERQLALDSGALPDFLPETAEIRAGEWRVAPIPGDLEDRRVEITGPVDRKMIINALNSGANVFMADFEDSNSPTWRNNLDGQVNLRDAIRGTIGFEARTAASPTGTRSAGTTARVRRVGGGRQNGAPAASLTLSCDPG